MLATDAIKDVSAEVAPDWSIVVGSLRDSVSATRLNHAAEGNSAPPWRRTCRHRLSPTNLRLEGGTRPLDELGSSVDGEAQRARRSYSIRGGWPKRRTPPATPGAWPELAAEFRRRRADCLPWRSLPLASQSSVTTFQDQTLSSQPAVGGQGTGCRADPDTSHISRDHSNTCASRAGKSPWSPC